jgi:hypothetical protein|eukprot:SAG25_NODE_16_length_24288_cov_31.926950_27_plen_74_part_00
MVHHRQVAELTQRQAEVERQLEVAQEQLIECREREESAEAKNQELEAVLAKVSGKNRGETAHCLVPRPANTSC